MKKYRNIIIIADIEGSSGWWDYSASSFRTPSWPEACRHMTLDVRAVTDSLLDEGVNSVMVKDFHRTGYNIFPELLDKRVKLIPGYIKGPVPGLGDPRGADALIMTGMHAPSGSEGFLAHTLTSRISLLTVNGEIVSEAQLFSSSLARYGVRPVLFSGCPVACRYAKKAMGFIDAYSIDKSGGPGSVNTEKWRAGLAIAARHSLGNRRAEIYMIKGPFDVAMTMRDGEAAAGKIAKRWKLSSRDDTVYFSAGTFDSLYMQLIRCCYLTPALEKFLGAGIGLYNFYGRLGLMWARRHI
jgi:D-aminopeptidase